MSARKKYRVFLWVAALLVTAFVVFASVLMIAPYFVSGDFERHGEIAIDKVTFPDKKLRAFVAEQYDRDGDGALSMSERDEVVSIGIYDTSSYAVYDKGISDLGVKSLDGLECFPRLTTLVAQGNKIETLDLSKLAVLTNVDLRGNSKFAIVRGGEKPGSDARQVQVLVKKGTDVEGADAADVIEVS